MPLSLQDACEIIQKGDMSRFVGEFESQYLDAKSQPYAFSAGDHIKREFAKDVAAFANADGGCLIIGAEITVSDVQAGEQISGFKPVPGDLFVPDQLNKILEQWLYPVPRGIMIRWFPDPSITKHGVGVILVPCQGAENRPFLITRSIEERKSTELLIGYAERHLDRTDVIKVAELHHALRTGMNLEATLLERISSVEALLQRLLEDKLLVPAPASIPATVTDARVERILAEGPFNE